MLRSDLFCEPASRSGRVGKGDNEPVYKGIDGSRLGSILRTTARAWHVIGVASGPLAVRPCTKKIIDQCDGRC
jgi:hypothetical protein